MGPVYIVQGDITTAVEVEALITPIDPQSLWCDQTHVSIQVVAGHFYHIRAYRAKEAGYLQQGGAFLATGNRQTHEGSFDHVIFVSNAGNPPEDRLIYRALQEAHAPQNNPPHPITRIGLPLMHDQGAAVTFDAAAITNITMSGIKRFFKDHPSADLEVYIVVPPRSRAIFHLEAQGAVLLHRKQPYSSISINSPHRRA